MCALTIYCAIILLVIGLGMMVLERDVFWLYALAMMFIGIAMLYDSLSTTTAPSSRHGARSKSPTS